MILEDLSGLFDAFGALAIGLKVADAGVGGVDVVELTAPAAATQASSP